MRRVIVFALLTLLATSCTSLPDHGPVHRVQSTTTSKPAQLPNFAPPGPLPGASPEDIANGFLRALTAAPFTTSVARKFLTKQAAASWQPSDGTIVYSSADLIRRRGGVDLNLSVTDRLDGSGSWLTPTVPTQSVRLDMVRVAGQWRIANPADKLVIPQTYFVDGFQRLNRYFFDQTGSALVSTPVFLLRGEQLATELVRSLLTGPSSSVADILHSAFPVWALPADLSVVVSAKGVAQVPVSKQVADLPADQLNKAMAQLAWTLRQVESVNAVQLTIDGIPLPLAGDQNAIPVTNVDEFNALTPSSDIWGLRDGRLVVWRGRKTWQGLGALGGPGRSWRSLAVNERTAQVAAVSSDGHQLQVMGVPRLTPASQGPLIEGTDLLAPSFDALGNLWVVDRADGRAVVWLWDGAKARKIAMNGVSGHAVQSASISGEGSRLVVGMSGKEPRVIVVNLLRDPDGAFLATGTTQSFPIQQSDLLQGSLVDLGWRSSDTLALLWRDDQRSRVSFMSSDGSPANPLRVVTSPYFGAANSLVVSPDSALPLALSNPDGRLVSPSVSGSWDTLTKDLSVAVYSR
ncbi:MAG: GerMN domain-containing protein [Nocardioidaceae bacterium]|nr:GerMN domain-containing protein [Nocardioidaceae bacterium]MCO5323838.1 LpqB family beta-propeller domain-containing protein [Nocardioidaceae bacterium]HMY09515.1 LpqB family beta-propeller domain-containing protein [Marmoricola sp.]